MALRILKAVAALPWRGGVGLFGGARAQLRGVVGARPLSDEADADEEEGGGPPTGEFDSPLMTNLGRPDWVTDSRKAFRHFKYKGCKRDWWNYDYKANCWTTWRMFKDVRKRLCIEKTAEERQRFRSMKHNKKLPRAFREYVGERLHAYPKMARHRWPHNRCQFTGREKGKVKQYRVSRLRFREYADHGKLSGMTRAYW